MNPIEFLPFEAGGNRVDLRMENGFFAGGILMTDLQSNGCSYRPFTSLEAEEWANLLPLRERKTPVLVRIKKLIFGD